MESREPIFPFPMSRDFRQEQDLAAGGFHQKYNPKEVLGRGVSSVVQRCVHKKTGQEYAVKVMEVPEESLSLEQMEEARRSIRNEVEILQMVLGHQSIITLIDHFSSATVTFLVFDLMKRGELFDYLTKKVLLTERESRVMMRELLEAVRYLHSRHVIHRDIKTENILLDDRLHIRLSDFGFSCIVQPGQLLKERCGTPGYLAPELLLCSMSDYHPGYGKEIDLWACGVVMYTLVSGYPPFWNRKQLIMLRNIMEAKYRMDSSEWMDRTHTVKDLITRMLTLDPALRITADQALRHPFFRSYKAERRSFTPIQKFRAGVWAARMCVGLFTALGRAKPVGRTEFSQDPYSSRFVRKLIDGCAFSIYGHWVKKGQNQNRAALFQRQSKVQLAHWDSSSFRTERTMIRWADEK
ncbi:LOW QUALITY PROTEIN: phosphorylase b kinase gamma catalytic chain, liver/testis isoform-like [Leucoraja erinacea]|uniref:LOW QUALITY PROTEIN: phosphorylase b kinase gamma catalytic chain, liver/testis isoform-like n=1 Tax=Leucoraja erinaceus TaxID=7782 RepID=UPI0024558C93|nr:LOW QUALITY PROTEIN: phosphorylase b kinase gamma catalytic chain, liver/testis isoform-like [Leucoraja erinacea]